MISMHKCTWSFLEIEYSSIWHRRHRRTADCVAAEKVLSGQFVSKERGFHSTKLELVAKERRQISRHVTAINTVSRFHPSLAPPRLPSIGIEFTSGDQFSEAQSESDERSNLDV